MTSEMIVPSGAAELVCDVAGTGPTVVCLHAGVADRRVWAGTISRLSTRFRLYAYDRRGYGETRYEPESFSHVDDLASVVAATRSDKVILIGNSLGGKVALDYTLGHPDRVAGLVLVAPAVGGAPHPVDIAPSVVALDEAVDAADDAGDNDEVNRLEAHLWLDGADQPEGRVGGVNRSLFLEMNMGAITSIDPGEELPAASAWGRLSELDVPTLVLFGEYDMEIMRSDARHIAKQAPNARFVPLPGVAHIPMLEAPDEFVASVSEFLAAPGNGWVIRESIGRSVEA